MGRRDNERDEMIGLDESSLTTYERPASLSARETTNIVEPSRIATADVEASITAARLGLNRAFCIGYQSITKLAG
eukprot:scaffold204640_cov33-Prasinocladus_malaysianus.AAC.1